MSNSQSIPFNSVLHTVPSGFPEKVSGNSTSPYSAFLSWNPPPLDQQNGDIIQYVINVTHTDTLNTMQYTTTVAYITITGLDPYTTYICVVAAETAVGVGPFSHLYFIQTDETGNKQLNTYQCIIIVIHYILNLSLKIVINICLITVYSSWYPASSC